MPRYQFTNTNTNETINLDCTYQEMLDFISSNPHMEQDFKINVVDPVGLGITKPPSDFSKYIVGKAKRAPGANKSQVEKRWHIPKEI